MFDPHKYQKRNESNQIEFESNEMEWHGMACHRIELCWRMWNGGSLFPFSFAFPFNSYSPHPPEEENNRNSANLITRIERNEPTILPILYSIVYTKEHTHTQSTAYTVCTVAYQYLPLEILMYWVVQPIQAAKSMRNAHTRTHIHAIHTV